MAHFCQFFYSEICTFVVLRYSPMNQHYVIKCQSCHRVNLFKGKRQTTNLKQITMHLLALTIHLCASHLLLSS